MGICHCQKKTYGNLQLAAQAALNADERQVIGLALGHR